MNQTEWYLKVQSRIRELRQKHGYSQRDVAKACGFTKQNITHIESGLNKPSAWTIWILEQLFKEKII